MLKRIGSIAVLSLALVVGLVFTPSAAVADATCPGVGNDCTQTITNQGGAGGNASAAAAASAQAGATAISNPVQVTTQGQQQGQGQHQGQGQLQGQKQGQGQGQVNQPNQTIEGDHVRVYASPPSMGGPALTAVPETCMGSTSTALSGGNGIVGVGLSFGSTWKSEPCERRMFARALQALGPQYTLAALALLAQDENVAKALKAANVSIPGAKAEAEPTPAAEAPKAEEKKSEPSNVGQRTSALTIHEAMGATLAERPAGVQGM